MKRFSSIKGSVCAAALLLVLAAPMARAAPYAYVANNGSNNVSVIDTATNTVAATVAVGNAPNGVAVSPDGSRAYVANSSGTVSVIDTATNGVVATVSVGFNPYNVAVSPDGSRVYVVNAISNTVSVIDTAANTVVATVGVGNSPIGAAVSPDGSRVYVANFVSNGTVSVIDAATDAVVATVAVGSKPFGAVVSPDGRRVYVSNAGSNTVSVIDTATDTVVTTVSVGHYPEGVAVSPDGSRVYVANNGGNTLSVIDTATNTVAATVPGGTSPFGVAMSPDGSRAYVANYVSNGTVSVIDTTNYKLVATVGVGINASSVSDFVGPGALIATNSSASGGAGAQVSGTVPTLANATTCATSDATVQTPAQGNVTFDAATGSFTYTPTSMTYSGPDSFSWRGQAPAGCTAADAPTNPLSNTATVSLTLDPLLTGLGNVTVGEGGNTQKAFSLTGSAPFTRTLASDNATVLPPAGMTVSPAACGTAGNLACTLRITAASTPGTAGVNVSATDKYGDTVTKHITVTVTAASSGGSTSSGGGGGASTPLGLFALAGLLGFLGLCRRLLHRRG